MKKGTKAARRAEANTRAALSFDLLIVLTDTSFFPLISTSSPHNYLVRVKGKWINGIFRNFLWNDPAFPRDHNVFFASIRQYGGADAKAPHGKKVEC